MKEGISRRNFLAGMGVAGLGIAGAAASMTGCSGNSSASTSSTSSKYSKKDISETRETEIVVVGAGISGLAAAVQAVELGAKVVLLESQTKTGGNGYGTEGLCGIGSKMSKEMGIDAKVSDIIIPTLKYYENRVDACLWKDMLTASGENIDWLDENGVLFEGTIDKGIKNAAAALSAEELPVFHWWKGGTGDSYSEPMTARAEELGVEVLTNAPGSELVVEGGKVTGIIVESGREYVKYNCKSVILATGGYAQNDEMMKARGWRNTVYMGFPGHNGDGLRMAFEAGAHDETAVLGGLNMFGVTGVTDMRSTMGALGQVLASSCLWVNGEGERFADESSPVMYTCVNSMRTQKVSYLIFDSAILADGEAAMPGLTDAVEEFVSTNPDNNVYKANSLNELAKSTGIEADQLASTVEEYNALCENGADADLGKDAALMKTISNAPFYSVRMDYAWFTTAGGIKVNRKMEVINDDGDTIPGLYAVGMDSCQLFREIYKIWGPGSANGYNVFSGRVAAQSAVDYMK